jgi:hypothetical protein
MNVLAAFSVFFSLLLNASGFMVAPSLAARHRADPVAWSIVDKKKTTSGGGPEPERKKPDPRTVKGLLQILVTGSPDGIALIGKPQHNWVTGAKEYTASKGPQKKNIFGKKETK